MPIETNRLKLPLPLGNESVSRVGINAIFEKIDEGVATREEVEVIRELVNEIDIPDASLTQKGKVQLSSKTNGDREDVASTEKALGDVMAATRTVQGIINNRDGYGTSTNNGNAYSVTLTPAPVAYVDGLRVTVKINAANTGAVTINVNGLGAKSVLKSNGSVMTSNALRVNSVYSLVYNGLAFILQGEGGEYGTAVAGDILTGKTFGTETGVLSGSMPNHGARDITITSYGQSFNIPHGFHNGNGQVRATYLPRKKFDRVYPGTTPSGSYASVNLGFEADIVEINNDSGAYLVFIKVYHSDGIKYNWQALGGGVNYLVVPDNFNGTTFTLLLYSFGGNYRVQAWA